MPVLTAEQSKALQEKERVVKYIVIEANVEEDEKQAPLEYEPEAKETPKTSAEKSIKVSKRKSKKK